MLAAVHPHADVWAWDPRRAAVEATSSLRDTAALANLDVHERPGLRADLGGGPADLVVVDGVFEVVDDDVRTQLVDAIGTTVRPGGLVCIAYKTMVGWSEILPVLRLMRHVAASDTGEAADRVGSRAGRARAASCR